MANQILLKRSNVVDASGNPKLPDASAMSYGEIAVNYAAGAETLSIKNSSDEIVTFSSDNRSGGGGGSSSINYAYGVYIQATDGTLYKTEDWDGTKTPNAIALFNSFVRILIALTDSSELNGTPSFKTTITNSEVFPFYILNGKTETMNNTSSNQTVEFAKNFTSPDGKNGWYVPSCGEMFQILSHQYDINEALTKCGGIIFNKNRYYYLSCNLYYDNSTGQMALYENRNYIRPTLGFVRPIKEYQY